MSPDFFKLLANLHFRSSPVDQSANGKHIRIPTRKILSDPSGSFLIKLISKNIGEWNPFEQFKCMICWQPLDIHGKDARSYMECPHCHQKAHQDHMLRWLAKKDQCPYCRGKL